MRVMGIDFGSSRIGVALSDPLGSIAFPRVVIQNDQRALEALRVLAETEKVGAVVMGDARTYAGGENTVTAASDAFAAQLETALGLPIRRVAEAWSSAEAARFAPKGKTHDDAAAAAIILQRYLDMQGNRVE